MQKQYATNVSYLWSSICNCGLVTLALRFGSSVTHETRSFLLKMLIFKNRQQIV